jgi:hypothetical protein
MSACAQCSVAVQAAEKAAIKKAKASEQSAKRKAADALVRQQIPATEAGAVSVVDAEGVHTLDLRVQYPWARSEQH